MARPIKIHKNGESKWTEADRLERFLDEGWSLEPGVESPTRGSKDRIVATAQVTKEVEDEEEEWDIFSGEDWADSIESVSDDTMPNEED